MARDSLAAKAIFPHDRVVPGQEISFCKDGETITCKVSNVCPLEGNKFVVWLQTSAEKVRLFWLMGKFYFNMPDGPEVKLI